LFSTHNITSTSSRLPELSPDRAGAVEGVGGLLATPKVADQAADLTISGRFRALTTRVQQQPSCDRFSGG